MWKVLGRINNPTVIPVWFQMLQDRQGAATWREVDLSVSDIIHKGRYTTIQKGILTHGENSIPVAVKCNKGGFY